MAVWYAYVLARAKYHEDHDLAIPKAGTIFPTFNEEVHAREKAAQVYGELKNEYKDYANAYWDALSQVNANRFMNAYVWTYVREPSWCASQEPKNLAAFRTWSESHLKNHHAVTYGALVVEK